LSKYSHHKLEKNFKKLKKKSNKSSKQDSTVVTDTEELCRSIRRLLHSSKPRHTVINFIGQLAIDQLLPYVFKLSEEDKKSTMYKTLYKKLSSRGFVVENPPADNVFTTELKTDSDSSVIRNQNQVDVAMIERDLTDMFNGINNANHPSGEDKGNHQFDCGNLDSDSSSLNILLSEYNEFLLEVKQEVKLNPLEANELMILEQVLNIEEELCSKTQSASQHNESFGGDKDSSKLSDALLESLFSENVGSSHSSMHFSDQEILGCVPVNVSTNPDFELPISRQNSEVGTCNLDATILEAKSVVSELVEEICQISPETATACVPLPQQLGKNCSESSLDESSETSSVTVKIEPEFLEGNEQEQVPNNSDTSISRFYTLHPSVISDELEIEKWIPTSQTELSLFNKFSCKPVSVQLKRVSTFVTPGKDKEKKLVLFDEEQNANLVGAPLDAKKCSKKRRYVCNQQRYMDILTEELNKETPDTKQMLMAMKQTFNLRRKYVDKYTAFQMITEFQALAYYDIVSCRDCLCVICIFHPNLSSKKNCNEYCSSMFFR